MTGTRRKFKGRPPSLLLCSMAIFAGILATSAIIASAVILLFGRRSERTMVATTPAERPQLSRHEMPPRVEPLAPMAVAVERASSQRDEPAEEPKPHNQESINSRPSSPSKKSAKSKEHKQRKPNQQNKKKAAAGAAQKKNKPAESRALATEEVELIGHTIVKLPTYGATYEGYDYRPPIPFDSKELKYVLGNVGGSSIQFDVKHGRMYWIGGGGIARSKLDGSDIQTLVTLERPPQRLAIDVERNKMFWTDYDRSNAQGTINAADLDGTNREALVKGARYPTGIAVDPKTGDVFYCEDKNTRRMHNDGTDDRQIMTSGGHLQVDGASNQLIWATDHRIWRANLDGTQAEVVADVSSQLDSFAIDPQDRKLYWMSDYRSLWRANLDGSQTELLMAVPPIRPNEGSRGIGEIALLAAQRWLYLFRRDEDGLETDRMKIPPLRKPVTKPAPPQIESITPPEQAIGGEVVVRGSGFKGATKVALFDDAAGNEVTVRFELRSDGELAFKMPTLSTHCQHAAVIVLTAGGVTVTLPKSCSAVKPFTNRIPPGTKQINNEAVQIKGQYENFWYIVGQPLPKTQIIRTPRLDGCLAYSESRAFAVPGLRGHNLFFLKDRAASIVPWRSVVYHEPFAVIHPLIRYSEEQEAKFIPVPAIRPSFLDELLVYQQPE